jgi:hypothetical protein
MERIICVAFVMVGKALLVCLPCYLLFILQTADRSRQVDLSFSEPIA